MEVVESRVESSTLPASQKEFVERKLDISMNSPVGRTEVDKKLDSLEPSYYHSSSQRGSNMDYSHGKVVGRSLGASGGHSSARGRIANTLDDPTLRLWEMEDWNSWNEGIHPVRSPSAERERRIARLQREKKERDERIKMIDYPHSYLGTMGHTTAPDVSPFLEEHTASSRAKIRGIDPNSIPSYRRYDYGGYRSSKYDKYDRLDKYDKYDRFNKYDTYDKSGKSYFHGDDNVRHGPYDKYDRYYDEMYGSKPGHGSRYDYDYEFDDVDEDVPRRHGYRSATALELDAADGEIDGKFYGKPIVERSVPSPVDRIMGRRGRVAEYPEYDTPTRYGGGYASSYTDSYTYSRDDDQVGARRHYGAVDLDMPRSYYSDSVGRVRDDWHYEGFITRAVTDLKCERHVHSS